MKTNFFTSVLCLLVLFLLSACNETPEQAQPSAQTVVAKTPAPTIVVTDAQICKDVIDHEPVNAGTSFLLEEKVYCWIETEAPSAPDSIVVKWFNEGDLQLTQALEIKESSFRTFCNKKLYFPGQWKVSILDKEGNSLKELEFQVQE